MRYELDSEGYVLNVYFGCYGTNCIEYEGNIPTGYETLVEWSEKAYIRAYKIVDDNLVYDAYRDAELQAQYEIDAERNANATIGYVNDLFNSQSSPFDDNLKKTTTKLILEDAGDYPIPEILIEVDEPTTFEDGIKLQVSNSNLAKITAVDETINGLTFTVNEDGTIHIQGTATADVEYEVCGTMDNTEPIFLLDCVHQIWGIDMIYILPYPVDGGVIDFALIPKIYNYDGVDRELISDYYYIDFRENKFVKSATCVTLNFPSGTTIDQTIWLLIRKEDGTADYEQAKSKGVIDIPIKELNPGEKVIISGNYVKHIDLEGNENIVKAIEPLVSYKDIADWDEETPEYDWTLLQYSDGIKVTTTYYTDIQLAGFDVTSDGLTTEIYSNYDYTQEDVDKAFAYVRNQTTLTEEELVKYDVNGDGVVNVYDVSYMAQLIKYGISKDTSLKFSIRNKGQKSTFDFLKIIDGYGNELTNIGAGGVDTNRLIVNGVDIGNKLNYSTEEQVVGKTDDGKFVYRKIFKFTSLSAIPTGISDLEDVFDMRCTIHQSSGGWRTLPWLYSSNNAIGNGSWAGGFYLRDDNNTIYFQVGSDLGAIDKGSITLEYTKTTD